MHVHEAFSHQPKTSLKLTLLIANDECSDGSLYRRESCEYKPGQSSGSTGNTPAEHNTQLTHNEGQRGLNDAHQQSTTKQEDSNKKQQEHNDAQNKQNTAQFNNNNQQERLNTNQQEANLAQNRNNAAQNDANAQQQKDNEETRKKVEESKPGKIDKCVDFINGVCAIGGGVTTMAAAARLIKNPADTEALALTMASGATAVAGGVGMIAKPAIKKCVGAACSLAKSGYDYLRPNQKADSAQSPVRRAVLMDMLSKRGIPELEIAEHVRRDSQRYLARNLIRKRMTFVKRVDMLDEHIWI